VLHIRQYRCMGTKCGTKTIFPIRTRHGSKVSTLDFSLFLYNPLQKSKKTQCRINLSFYLDEAERWNDSTTSPKKLRLLGSGTFRGTFSPNECSQTQRDLWHTKVFHVHFEVTLISKITKWTHSGKSWNRFQRNFDHSLGHGHVRPL